MNFTFLFVVLINAFGYSQNVYLSMGTTYSSLDWTYLNPNGTSQEQYKAPLISYAVGLGVEYMDRGLFSLSSEASFYRSGGQFSDAEKEQRPEPGETFYININGKEVFSTQKLGERQTLNLRARQNISWGLRGVSTLARTADLGTDYNSYLIITGKWRSWDGFLFWK